VQRYIEFQGQQEIPKQIDLDFSWDPASPETPQ
jgi:hypothetical protein